MFLIRKKTDSSTGCQSSLTDRLTDECGFLRRGGHLFCSRTTPDSADKNRPGELVLALVRSRGPAAKTSDPGRETEAIGLRVSSARVEREAVSRQSSCRRSVTRRAACGRVD